MLKWIGKLRNASTFESLGLRDYRLLWMGQLSTSLGQWMDQTSRSWLIYSLTGSPLQLGLVNALRGAPLLFFGILAGVFADRYSRKAQLIISQVVNAVLNLALATLIMTGQIQVWHIYVTSFLAGTVQAFQQPARQVLVNDLVRGKRLMNALALNNGAVNVSRSVGPALCGIIISAFGVDISYYVQGVMYAVATIWTAQIVVPPHESFSDRSAESKPQSFFSSAKEGFRYIAHNRIILALMVLGLAPILLGQPYLSLMPIFAVSVFHGGADIQGLLLGIGGVGAIIGALVVASLGNRQGSTKILIGSAAGYGLCIVLFGQSPVLLMALFFTFLASMANSQYTTQNQTIIQVLTPYKLRGRVLGVYLLNRALAPLGALLAGFLAQVLGGPLAVTVLGTACFLVVMGVALAVPDLWRLKLPSEAEMAGAENREASVGKA